MPLTDAPAAAAAGAAAVEAGGVRSLRPGMPPNGSTAGEEAEAAAATVAGVAAAGVEEPVRAARGSLAAAAAADDGDAPVLVAGTSVWSDRRSIGDSRSAAALTAAGPFAELEGAAAEPGAPRGGVPASWRSESLSSVACTSGSLAAAAAAAVLGAEEAEAAEAAACVAAVAPYSASSRPRCSLSRN